MNINTSNYESWFLDYHEGNLRAGQVAELFLFLEQHPHLKELFEAFEATGLPEEECSAPSYPGKEALKKNDRLSESNVREWLVMDVEGALSTAQSEELELFLQHHPSYYHDRELFRQTKLAAPTEVSFPHRESLYRKSLLNESSIQEWLIAELEGDLSLTERKQLLDFLAVHPQYQHDRALYRQTLLQGEQQDVYAFKNKLRRGQVKSLYSAPRLMRVAAVLLLLLGAALVIRLQLNQHTKEEGLAENPAVNQREIPAAIRENEAPALVASVPAPEKGTTAEKVTLPSEKIPNAALASTKSPVKKKRESVQQENNPVTAPRESEFLASMENKPVKPLPQEELFVFAERRYTPKATIAYENPAEPPSLASILQPAGITDQAIGLAVKNLNKAAGEELLGTANQPARLPLGSRLLKFAAKAIGKISNDKVKVRTAFNPVTGKLSAYEVETEKKVIQKQF